MSKYFILVVCVAIVIGFFSLQKSEFNYVRTVADAPLVVKDKAVTVLFVGDIMLGRNVENLMKQNSASYPFAHIQDLLTSADSVVANLEGPITDPHAETPSNGFRFSFPATTAQVLKEHGVGVVSLANNHTDNYGASGFEQTRQFLDAAGVTHVGNPDTFAEKYTVRASVGDQHFLYVAFNFTKPGFNTASALSFVKNFPRQPGEFMIALVHGGTEYKLHSNAAQESFYRGLIDAGADLVIAHHPHVVEEVETYHNRPIFYSLGNFIFDQYFSKDVQEGLAVKLTLSDATASYELIPLASVHSQPEVMAEPERSAWLQALAGRSDLFLKNDIQQGRFSFGR